ncbi:MAG: preprotein translocase subunit SecG [Desulfopila sp.]
MDTLLIILHVLVCFLIIGIVLLQQGKGADIGASFGGSSQSLFGTEGPLPLLNKITTAVAIIFMVTSVSLAYISAHKSTGSVMQQLSSEQKTEQESELAVPESEEKITPEEQTEESQN